MLEVKTSCPCDRMADFKGRYLFRLYRENVGLGCYLIGLIIFTFVECVSYKQLFLTQNSRMKIRLKKIITDHFVDIQCSSVKDASKINGRF